MSPQVQDKPGMLPGADDIDGLVNPTGYKLLVLIPQLSEQMRNGLYQPSDTRRLEEQASLVAQVIGLGPLAYKDEKRFPTGAWCKRGDFVMLRAYSGTAFRRAGQPYEYRLINDDTVEAVISGPDPTEIERRK